MATIRRTPAQELTTSFSNAAGHEVKRRDVRTREQLARARRDAALQREADRIKTAKGKQDAAFERKILKIFRDTKKIYDKAFGDTGNMVATIEGNKLKIEEVGRPRYSYQTSEAFEPTYIDGAFGKIITVKNGTLSYRSWGHRIDPQYRNSPLGLNENRLREALMGPAMLFGDAESLKKMAALRVASAQKQKAPRPRR